MCVSYLLEAAMRDGPLEELPADTPRRVQEPNRGNMALFRERIVNGPRRPLTGPPQCQTDHHGRKRVQNREFLVFFRRGARKYSNNGGMSDHTSRVVTGIPWIPLHE
jgi:hypothetical protein